MEFDALVGSSVQVTAVVDRIVEVSHSNIEMILLKDVYLNDEFFRNHSWTKMAKRLSSVDAGDKFTATATLINYFSSDNIYKDKLGLKSFRNVKIHNKKKD